MAKPEWGTKHRCTSCGAKFYDFHKKTLICPKCDAEVQPEILLRSRRTSQPEEKKPAPKAEVAEEVETDVEDGDDDLLLDDDEDGDVSILSDDDDDNAAEPVVEEPKRTEDS